MSRLNEKSILFTENTLTFPVLKNRLFLNRVSISLNKNLTFNALFLCWPMLEELH